VGSTRERIGSDGSVRYTALYRDLKGRQRSAVTFTTQRQADRAWQRAESRVAQGQLGEPGRGRQTFRDYAEKTWLPNHEVEATTRQSYTYILRRHILPEFGPMRMIDILPEHALSRSRAGAAALGIPAQARPAQTIRKPGTQHGLIIQSRSSLGHSRRKAAVTSPRSHLRGRDLRRTLPRVRARAGELS
jgi:Phage integrase, N-terminal SAM-like domain